MARKQTMVFQRHVQKIQKYETANDEETRKLLERTEQDC